MAPSEILPAAIIFDFDGLILDTETCEFLTVADVFADHGLVLDRRAWVDVIGTADHPHWTEMLESALGHPLADRAATVESRRVRYHARIVHESVRPGVVELAEAAAAAGLGVAIASSSPAEWVVGHLERLDLAALFPVVVTRDDVGAARTKPAPDLFLLAAERLGVDPRESVVLEDSTPGVKAAHAAGCVCVAVPGGMTADSDVSLATLVVASVADLDLGRLVRLMTDVAR